jgi:hypothetical protein
VPGRVPLGVILDRRLGLANGERDGLPDAGLAPLIGPSRCSMASRIFRRRSRSDWLGRVFLPTLVSGDSTNATASRMARFNAM